MTKESRALYMQKSKINGVGLHVQRSYMRNDFISHIAGEVHVFQTITPAISKRMVNWIGCGRHSWINTDQSLFRFINHSCDPNVYITGKRTVKALRDIHPQEELTMDYSLTEAEIGWGFTCSCGTRFCRGFIGPIWTLKSEDLSRYHKAVTKTFLRVYKNCPREYCV